MRKSTQTLLGLTLSILMTMQPLTVFGSELQEISEQEAADFSPVYTDDSYDVFTSNPAQTNIQSVENPNTEDTFTQGLDQSSKFTAGQQRQVSLTDTEFRRTDFNSCLVQKQVNIGNGTHKFEIVYTASAELPEILFKSPTNNIYDAKPEKDINNGTEKFITRTGYYAPGFSNLNVVYVYISGMMDPGTWNIQVSFPAAVKEFFIFEANVVDDWETLNTDYMTSAKDVISWYIENGSDSTGKNSTMVKEDIAMLVVAEPRPTVNDIKQSATKIEEKNVDLLTVALVSVIVLIIIVVGIYLYISKRTEKDKANAKSSFIKKLNRKLKKKKQTENNTLDDYINEIEDEYSDDDIDEDANMFDNYDEYNIDPDDEIIHERNYTVAPWEENPIESEDINIEDIEELEKSNKNIEKEATKIAQKTEDDNWDDDNDDEDDDFEDSDINQKKKNVSVSEKKHEKEHSKPINTSIKEETTSSRTNIYQSSAPAWATTANNQSNKKNGSSFF